MIEIKNATFSYRKEPVFTGLNLEIQNRGLTLLSGANGRGKTTLLKLLAGLVRPDSGTISYDDQNIAKLKVAALAELRSVAPQRRRFELAFTVEEILAIIPHPTSRKSEIIERLELRDLLATPVTELSLGQQQRVSVALALLQESKYYLLDEPFSAQDEHFESALISLLKDIAHNKGVLVVSHHLESVRDAADFLISLDEI